MKPIKFSDINTRKELKSRIKNGVLSVGCHWFKIRHLVSKVYFDGSEKITVTYSPGYGGVAKITRYI